MPRKMLKKQVNLNLKKSTDVYITRAAKRQDITKAAIVEQALEIHKVQHRTTV